MAKADWHYLYDTKRWKELRLYHMAIEPLCRLCKQANRIVPVAVVDHITPHKGDVKLFFEHENLQSLCAVCHNSCKQKYERSGYMVGSDPDGIPLDSAHHWNR